MNLPNNTPVLEVSDVSHSYHKQSSDPADRVLESLNLKVYDGEFVAIVGFSGAGKSTLISLLAGLEQPTRGGVFFRGKEVTGADPQRGVVFQSYSLMPWLSVKGNIALAVDQVARKKSRAERQEQVQRYIDMVGLTHAAMRKPAELSGGMRQRVAVARALAMQPDVLLLDEPLSALDALTRARLQDELSEISQKENKTIILITNDVDEALLLADKVIALTPAPAATLGEPFTVNISHPRDRAAMNHNQEFIRLRSEITQHLIALRDSRVPDSPQEIQTENVVNLTPQLPKAVRKAQASSLQTRYLEFSDITKVYPTPEGDLTVVEGFDLKMDKGEFVTLIGHSGCGKSTVLSMAAGLNPISRGGVILDGTEVLTSGPDRAVVFQAPSLMPWLSALDNVMLGADQVYPHASRKERRDVAEYYLERVGLADSINRSARDLSNGMQQRVGIARAFALSPKLLLLDEPFGMLDSLTRWELQDVLMEVWQRTKVTTVCVTHDVDEAILLADRVVMMSNGPNARVGNIMPVSLDRPRSRKALFAHPDYYAYREQLLEFLEAYEGGASPSQDVLDRIASKRHKRTLKAEDVEADTPQRDLA
ncbi:MAG: ABC transporter ATP-binding protein [Granulosicoccus sp.]|nr:ABC transporter ATP-binding protein [Granulosicoccus sp.]